ncbi:unnamed protein product [Larinioides sclopetarius]|uniref:NADH:ubiquinone oxidoreductase intermediate-associated protein 30 domain-containing protein n=1 Tax=Larinioides sclopetarius TaxID=280406 RepID=A0AAV2AK24_9ARAC
MWIGITAVPDTKHVRPFSQTARNSFYEQDKRGAEYPVFPFDKKTWTQHVIDGAKIFVGECKLFWEETKEHFRNDPPIYHDGATENCLEKWRIGSDKINKEGFSDCNFFINDKGKGVFHGNIDITPPKDGNQRFAGYCGIKSVRKTKSFLRDDWYDWNPFTHLEMKVKGDGRNYMININMGMYFDVTWFDMYSYALHTRGGPYWQVVRIPFSKFFLTYKGRTQDKQDPMPRHRVNGIGITAAAVSGPFHLEIDYIGVYRDMTHTEETAYEMYTMPKEIVTA